MEPIAILIPTYNRVKIIDQTISRLIENLMYPGFIQVFVGADGSDSTPEVLRLRKDTVVLRGSSGSLGANLNRLIDRAVGDGFELLFQLDDDHWLNYPLNLVPHAEKLLSDPSAGWIRLMQVGGHKYTATLDGDYWRIHWDSEEHYIASNRPHLKHARFHEYFGYYPEGLSLGLTEEGFNHQCKDKVREVGGGIDVLVPLPTYTEYYWSHEGESWQLKGL